MKKKIILTGGGTAGHVTPNLALVPGLRELGYEVLYIGSENGMEKALVEAEGIPYYGIPAGKLRRYLSFQNFTDAFRVLAGCAAAAKLLRKLKPEVIFSKGGFVSVPVMVAAGQKKIPAILHESDMTPGLANRMAMRYAKKICCCFPETLDHLPAGKGILTGTPIREALFQGEKEKGLRYLGFSSEKPVLLIVGGSSGSVRINEAVRECLSDLLPDFSVAHLCGKGNLDQSLAQTAGYRQIEYAGKEMADLLAAADLVISRAGANAISELLALRKPHLLIPLSLAASRGDQIQNAASFEAQGFSMVLKEEDLTRSSLLDAVHTLAQTKEDRIRAMEASPMKDSVRAVLEVIEEAVNGRN